MTQIPKTPLQPDPAEGLLLPALPGGLADAEVFRASNSRVTLAQVLAAAEGALKGTALRDTRSAFAALARGGVDLAAVLATAATVRALLDGLSPARLGVAAKRLANIRSLVTQAVERFGQRRTWVTKEIPLSPAWASLFAQIAAKEHRWALGRLASFCSLQGIAPAQVCVETLRGLFAALEAEEMIKKPRGLLKHIIAVWNLCHSRVPGWPDRRLASPFKVAPAMLPLEAFPASFQADVAAWEARLRHADPLDETAPARARRPDTVQGYRFAVRRLASALVRAGVETQAITDLAVLVEPEALKTALREYLPGQRQVKTPDYAHKMAVQMLTIPRMHLGHTEAQLKPLQTIAGRIKSPDGPRMGERNRVRLEPFDDPAVVQRLLTFPEAELGRAVKLTNPLRRAKGVERALAISLAIFTGLRVKNLRTLHLQENLRRSGGRVFLQIPAEQMKTHRALELELPRETIALLDTFLKEYRPLLPGSEGPYLFPGPDGGPRSYSAMRDALSRSLKRHAGITVSPHLYRHIIAKVVVEKHPELALDVSRRLGHASINTTYQSYLGTEGPAASRRINDLLKTVRDTGERRK